VFPVNRTLFGQESRDRTHISNHLAGGRPMSAKRSLGEPDAAGGAPSDSADTDSAPRVAELEGRVAELEAALADVNDRLLRALAEQENIRRRAEREREDAVRFAASGLAGDLLPTADNLRRAVETVPGEIVADERVWQLLSGIAATERALLEALEKHAIRRIDPLGEPFDPNRHHAVFEAPDAERPAGTIIEVLQPGYLHHDRVLRPAMVGVSKGGDEVSSEPNGAAEQPRRDKAH
jgi:molecular chaperone GrpE